MGKSVNATPTPEIMVGQGGANTLENKCHTTPPLKGGRGWWGVHHLFGVGWGKSNQTRSINDHSTASLRRTGERCVSAWCGAVRAYAANLVPMPLILIGRETVGWTYVFALCCHQTKRASTGERFSQSPRYKPGCIVVPQLWVRVQVRIDDVVNLSERHSTFWQTRRKSIDRIVHENISHSTCVPETKSAAERSARFSTKFVKFISTLRICSKWQNQKPPQNNQTQNTTPSCFFSFLMKQRDGILCGGFA